MTLSTAPGAEIAVTWGLGLPAAISIVLSTIVVAVFARDCLGRSRAAVATAALLWVSNAALACARGPVPFVACWQLQWFLAWCISLFLADDEVQAWLGRMLISGWLLDALLMTAALTLSAATSSEDIAQGTRLLAWGGGLSLAGRLAVLPVGAHRLWNNRIPRPAIDWIVLTALPPAVTLGLRLIDLVQIAPAARLPIAEFLVFAALAAALSSLRQEWAFRETVWRLAAALSGVAAVSLLMPAWPGQIAWIVAALGTVAVVRRLPNAIPVRSPSPPHDTLLGRVETLAADEWGIPRAWRLTIAMPSRGAAQVLRFVDGFVFEQLPRQAMNRLQSVTTPLAHAVPELFGRLLVPILLGLAFIVLLALAFR